MDELLVSSATKLAAMIRTRKVSSREVVDVHIAHAQRIDDDLNAMAEERFTAARREADAADAKTRKRATKLPPFHGVPCSIKESFLCEDMPNTAGLLSRKGIRGVKGGEATAVKRLREAGAIPLGVTNVPELCMWIETNNAVYGRTNNPYDPARIVGGSSGGEGAMVGSGATPFGLGSDVGGSIRLPAFFNGVFGHKATGGLVPATGQFPMAARDALRFLTTGPLTRKAEDLHPLLRIVAGPDGEDPAVTGEYRLADPAKVRLDRLTILDVGDDGRIDVDADLRDAQRRAADHLASRGANVERAAVQGFASAFDIWSAMLSSAGGPTFAELLGNGAHVNVVREFWRWAFHPTPYTLPALILVALEKVTKLDRRRIAKHLALGQGLREDLHRRLQGDVVMLYPSFPRVAPLHGDALRRPFDAAYTAILNVMEVPVTQVPLGLNEGGLPLGVQVVAGPGNDHLTLAVALELERAFGGWVPPPRIFRTSTRLPRAARRIRS